MKLRTRLYIFSTLSIGITTYALLFAGLIIINRVVFNLNQRMLSKEVQNIVGDVNERYQVLKDSGVADIKSYRDSVMHDISKKIKREYQTASRKISLIDGKGQTVAGYNIDLSVPAAKNIFSRPSGFFEEKKDKMVCFYASTEFEWKVVLFIKSSEYYAKSNLYFKIANVIGVAILIISLSIAYFISSRLSQQIFTILDCVKKVAGGELNSKITIKPFSEEIKELQDGLNTMIDKLQQREMEREIAEEETRKHQKIETLGILAGGIAHDFNNILTAIRGNLQLALLQNPGEELKPFLIDTEKASIRAIDLTRQLLAFSKGAPLVRKSASVSDILLHSGNFVLRGTKSKCEFSLPENLWKVNIDVSQICQVVDNMIINGNQAMPSGGIIEVKAANTVMHPENNLRLTPGRYVAISIRDHGSGIPPENIEKIFEPFFTTKTHGNGLGLSTSYSIVKKHGGTINVESYFQKGAEFTTYLPASNEKELLPSEAEQTEYKGGGKVLVMDDQESIRSLLGKMLSAMNCKCEFAENGREAIEIYSGEIKDGHKFDIVIMDLTVPGGMGGKDTMDHLLKIDPQLKAVIASGYSNDPVMTNFKEYGFSAKLDKPFRLNDLRKILSDLMPNTA
ncbi:MAG: hypothetical protein A2020_01420 [Lentisphaerae bacterium GWF2_45_14]|nr:MAG: hypothetical protein A2020_01420 [Lentisphaerae bacterium GWF2_45_14]